MSMFSTLEEAIEAAREEYLANHPELDEADASISQFGLQKYVMQDGDIMWQAEFLKMKANRANACQSAAEKQRRLSLMVTLKRLSCVRNGWLKTRYTSGMKVSFNWSRRWTPKKVKRQRKSGKTTTAIQTAVIRKVRDWHQQAVRAYPTPATAADQ